MEGKQLDQFILRAVSRVLPREFGASIVDEGVRVSVMGRPNSIVLSGEDMMVYSCGSAVRLAQTIESNMVDLQDFILEMTGTPWPTASLQSRPLVTALEGERVLITFEVRGETVFTFDEIKIDEMKP